MVTNTKRLRSVLAKEMEDYKQRLAAHDWSYEMSEDPSRYSSGSKDRRELLSMQQRLDPDRKIWKQFEK